jgi:hypothetical protein
MCPARACIGRIAAYNIDDHDGGGDGDGGDGGDGDGGVNDVISTP